MKKNIIAMVMVLGAMLGVYGEQVKSRSLTSYNELADMEEFFNSPDILYYKADGTTKKLNGAKPSRFYEVRAPKKLNGGGILDILTR